MSKATIYKPILSKGDIYQESINTNYARDQTTGGIVDLTPKNIKNIIEEQFNTYQETLQSVEVAAAVAPGIHSIITIPEGKVWIINYLQANFINVAAAGNYFTIAITSDVADRELITMISYDSSKACINTFIAPTNPIIAYPGDELYFYNSQNCLYSYVFNYYEVSKSDLLFKNSLLI